MRKFTNKYNLPQTIVDAVSYDSHPVGGDISVTQLIDAPQVRILKNKHKDEIVEDVSELLYALMGTALHHILERGRPDQAKRKAMIQTAEFIRNKGNRDDNPQLVKAADFILIQADDLYPAVEEEAIQEQTLTAELPNGKILYGTFDRFEKVIKKLQDYKFCSVYQYLYPEARKKWFTQLNVYAWLLWKNGYEVESMEIIAFFRDFQAQAFNKNKDYPKSQTTTIDVPLLPMETVEAYINNRAEKHRQADLGNVPLCTGEERWASATTYGAKIPSNIKAIKVFASEFEYKEFEISQGHKHKGLYMETRHGESRRCDSYCPVKDFCEQRKQALAKR